MTEAEALSVRMWPMGEPTTIDAIARLHRFDCMEHLGAWAEELPNAVKSDYRFTKAVKQRLTEIRRTDVQTQ